jgi:RND family efflux transporter MFP subunit
MAKKTYVILAIIIAIIIGGVYYFKSKKPITEYTTAQAEKGNLVRTVSVTGKVVSPIEADLSFKISGQIKSLLVDVSDHVEKGQKIATIDRGTLLDDLAQARQAVKVEKQTLYDMKMRKNETTYSYFQEEAQRAEIKKAEDAVGEILTQIGQTTLYSPISGTVIKKNVEAGEITVANAVTATTSVVTIAADGPLETHANVPESDIINVKVGQSASVSLDAFPSDEKLSAEVVEIDPSSTVIQDVVYYRVKLKFNNLDERMKNGMSVDADINTAEKNNVVMIPLRAIKTEGNKKYVEILKSENTTKKIYIETGLAGDDGMVEITSGLSGGENVVTLTKTP